VTARGSIRKDKFYNFIAKLRLTIFLLSVFVFRLYNTGLHSVSRSELTKMCSKILYNVFPSYFF